MELLRDLRYSLRIIRRNPGYAIAAMLCLAFGIGVNATVFSLLDGMYFQLLPAPAPERLVALDRNGAMPLYWRDYLALRSGLRAFSGVAAVAARGTFMDVGRANFAVTVETVSANYGDVVGARPIVGRWFTPQDEAPGGDPVVVIRAAVWTKRFDRDPAVTGRSLRIENQWYRVIGVAAADFRGASPPTEVDAWIPLVTFPIFRPQLTDARGAGPAVNLIGRIAPGATLAAARAEIAVADARLRRENSAVTRYGAPMTVEVFRGIRSMESRRALRPIAALLAAVVIVVLLIACVNVANLLLSRAAVRRREIALRRSMGASRARLVRQGIAEGLILAAGGAALGTVAAAWTDLALSRWLPSAMPDSVLRNVYLQMNWRVAAFTAAVAFACAVLFSLAPALEGSSGDLVLALKDGARSGRGAASKQRELYVVAQVALSLVLLIAAGLLLRALERTSRIDPGFATDHRLYLRLFTPGPDFTPESSTRLFADLLDRARALPQVHEATLSLAVLGFSDSECVSAEGGARAVRMSLNVVEPNYFRVMDIPLLRGRNFANSDQPHSPRVTIVNETMARRLWPGEDAVGKTIWMGCGKDAPPLPAEVIAVARDSKYSALDEGAQPFFYVSRLQVWWNGFFALIVRAGGDPQGVGGDLIRLARAAGPDLRIYELRTMEELIGRSLWLARWQAALLGAFGLLAIALSVIGLYGVVACTVAQRTQEIGIRMAIGAQRSHVLRMILARALRLTALGLGAGLLLSAAAAQYLRGFLHGVGPLDPIAYGGASLAWVVIAAVASYLPARRAARVDPAISLRYE